MHDQPVDTFARFVEVLVETLDERLSGEELGARLHLSRYHANRVIAATAGETPGAFRRRVLLERAAHRLLTSDAEVLPVAMDAGYSSHEAFTRAFTRAFGASPSAWRRQAARYELATPNGVHFTPPGSLRLPASRKVSAMDLVTKMVDHHVQLITELLERASKVDGGVLERPIEVSVEGIDDKPTMLSLLQRLVGQLAQWEAAMSSRPYDFAAESSWTLRDLKRQHAVSGPAFRDDVARIAAEEHFDDTFVDATCDPPRVFTYGGMVAHVLTWASHRRTLVLGALHDAGFTDLVKVAEPLEAFS